MPKPYSKRPSPIAKSASGFPNSQLTPEHTVCKDSGVAEKRQSMSDAFRWQPGSPEATLGGAPDFDINPNVRVCHQCAQTA
jgi:hypothetical protein